MKTIKLIGILSLFMLSGCQQIGNNTAGEESQITGIAKIGLFGGTEMGCEYGEIGSRVDCNSGSGTIYLETDDGKIYLEGIYCPASEILVHDENGKYREYVAAGDCDEDLEIGASYSAAGSLRIEEDVWRNGKQINEEWLVVSSIAKAN